MNVSHSSVARWIREPTRKKYDSSTRKQNGKTVIVVDTIRIAIQANPLLSTRDLANLVLNTLGVKISRELARSVLMNDGFTRKKARFFGCPPDLEEKTQIFIRERESFRSKGFKFYSLDETSFGRHGAPVYGYAHRGKSVRIQKRTARVSTQSALVIADNCGNMVRSCINGSFSTITFVAFLESLELQSDSVILLDNVAFHKARMVRDVATRRQWHLLYVPPYSPWFNPIEGIFSVIKRAWYAGSSIDESFDRVKPEHANAFFRYSFRLDRAPI